MASPAISPGPGRLTGTSGCARLAVACATLLWAAAAVHPRAACAQEPSSAVAQADPAPPEGPAPPDPPRPTSARYLDASADRLLLTSTAETHPEGTFYVSTVYILPQLGYALTDRVQVAVAGIGGPDGGFLDVSLKANLLRQRHVRISTTAAIDYARGTDLDLLFGRARGTLQWCVTGDCHASVSVSGMAVVHAFPSVAMPYGVGAGLSARVAPGVRLLLDFASVHNATEDLFFLDFPFYFVSYGVRLSGKPSWSLDIGMVRSLDSSDPTIPAPRTLQETLGVPFFAFTYRTGPRIHPY